MVDMSSEERTVKKNVLSMGERIWSSLIALAICWFSGGIALGIAIHDLRGIFLFFIWSIPFFAVGWLLVGLPVILLGDRVLRVPVLVMGIAGAFAGFLSYCLPFVVGASILGSNGKFKMDWNSPKAVLLKIAIGIAACALMLYRWMLAHLWKEHLPVKTPAQS